MPSVDLLSELDMRGFWCMPFGQREALQWGAAIVENQLRQGHERLMMPLDDGTVHPAVRGLVLSIVRREPDLHIMGLYTEQVANLICDQIVGFGPLQPLIERCDISEVMVNRFDDVWIETEGTLIHCPGVRFWDEAHMLTIVQRVFSRLGGEANTAIAPLITGQRIGNLIVSFAMPPAQRQCSLQVSKKRSPTTGSGVPGVSNAGAVPLLQELIASRANIFIAGASVASRLEVMHQLADCIRLTHRLVAFAPADTLSRPSDVTVARNEVDLTSYLMSRPDSILLGELSGMESMPILHAMLAGHCAVVSIPTDSPERLYNFIAVLALQSGVKDAVDEFVGQVAAAADVLVYMEGTTTNCLGNIALVAEIEPSDNAQPVLHTLWQRQATTTAPGFSEMVISPMYLISERLRQKLGRRARGN